MNNLLYFLPMAIVIGVAGLIRIFSKDVQSDVRGVAEIILIFAFWIGIGIAFVLFIIGLINLTN